MGTYQSIVKATRESASHLATMQRHARKIADAKRNDDPIAEIFAQRLYDLAKKRHEKAYAATRFPWEI